MLGGFANVSVSNDLTEQIKKSLKELGNKQVFVGIPQEDDKRTLNGKDGTINNAELLYIHSNGIRQQAMIIEMSKDIDKGMKYSMAHSLYIQSHGSPLWQSPPRPVLEPAIENDKEEIAGYLKQAIKFALDGDNENSQKQLEQAGQEGQNASRAWFTNSENGWAPNSPETIERKGSSNPLINTGEMRKAITYIVKEGD